MKKVFISTTSFGVYSSKPLDLLKERNIHVELNPLGRTLTEEEIIKFLEGKEGLIAGTEPLMERVLDKSKLEVISRVGAGLDNIDVRAAEKRNIKIFNTPYGPTNAVAELTLGLILNLLRFIGSSDRNIRNGKWKKEMGDLLYEKSVGIIGFGRIGRKLAELLRIFRCRIFIYDPFISYDENKVEQVVSPDVLLKNVDIVSLHLPYSQENHHLINRKRLEMMKSNAILINTSRGGLVDEKALYDCLRNRQIAGAALDTFEEEPYSGQLHKLENVILTPHIGSYARKARIQMEVDAVKNLLRGFGIYAGH